jgi:hypothetical protein
VLPGCGSSSNGKPIPASPANRMIALIQKADQQSSAGICSGADAKVREAQNVLQTAVPSSVDASVRQGLADGLARLRSLIQQQCQAPQQTTTTTPTTTTPTTTTPTTTTPTGTNTGTNTGTGTTTTGTGGTPPPPAAANGTGNALRGAGGNTG